ncbi:glutamyl-tRNA(Gln) amidotransferase subunit A [Iodidimonas gelatinilytica]|uniref:Glutamyl-tRNA(Gln) amidotransferase subunit A n=1 Tax=Iodidimonas gelatinilytica TaxID=1236966 RepID=A0A5A7MPB6_9PROT|nr:Asp-tRNA(Asn)/Glu-tRNA(Gln) amidotransferase subunit GatA [Iodidimonas gelatinilytica]GEQ97840.1 glutamyl-tRNA(Gln) amidotransferase subunit A [Iodidimonas gelatinilytica]
MSDLNELSIAEARDRLAARDLSARELVQASIAAMEAAKPLNVFVTETPERALEMADAADARLKAGDAKPMTGIPVAVKDLFCTKDVRTTAGSHMLEPFTPPYESTVTANLWDNGAVMLGKVNMDEFAMGSSNETSAYGPVKNPWRLGETDTVPGGSSGGSVAAVAGRIAPCATGSDTGGSIRQPAAFTGTVGLKPTYGRCSRYGMVAFASSLDQAGPITRSVRDAAIMLGAMAGHDVKDSTCVDVPVPDYEAALTGDIRGLKIGIPKEYHSADMPREIEDMWQQGMAWLRDRGAQIVDISLPHTKYALPTYYIVAPAEASSNLARYDGVRYGHRAPLKSGDGLTEMYGETRAEGFGDEVKRRILIGTYVLSAGYYDAYYLKAQKIRTLIADDFRRAYEKVDAILTPTAPSAAFGFGAKQDPLAMYMNDVFTVPASLAGLPGISIPAALSAEGLPLGLQILGRAFDEETVLKVAGVMEDAAAFTAKPKTWWS